MLHWAHAGLHCSGGFGLRLRLCAVALPAARDVANRLDVGHDVDRRRPRLPLEPDRLVPLLHKAALGSGLGGNKRSSRGLGDSQRRRTSFARIEIIGVQI